MRGAESVYPTVLLLIRTRSHKSDKIDSLKHHVPIPNIKSVESNFELYNYSYYANLMMKLKPNIHILNILIRRLVTHVWNGNAIVHDQNNIFIFHMR